MREDGQNVVMEENFEHALLINKFSGFEMPSKPCHEKETNNSKQCEYETVDSSNLAHMKAHDEGKSHNCS